MTIIIGCLCRKRSKPAVDNIPKYEMTDHTPKYEMADHTSVYETADHTSKYEEVNFDQTNVIQIISNSAYGKARQ